MSDIGCRIDGCERPLHVKVHQLCNVHYIRFRTLGNPLAGGEERGQPLQWLKDNLDTESDDCLLWPFSTNDHGYGRIRTDGKEWVASRLMCTMKRGDAPSRRHEAAHSCGNGHIGCTNPNHLRWATPEENQADRVDHGTSNRGTRNGGSVFDEKSVMEAIDLKARGMLQKDIAAQLGVSQMALSDILNGQRWSWLTGIPMKVRLPRKLPTPANDNEKVRVAA